MAGEALRSLWTRLSNRRGEVLTLPADVQEKLARLDKVEKDNAALGYRLRASERVLKEAGEAVQYDAQGNPVGYLPPEPARPPVMNGRHPLSGLHDDPDAVDAYYTQLYTRQLNAAGYVTVQQAEQLAAHAYQRARGDGQVWRTFDKLTAKSDYADLGNPASDLAQRTAAILQARGLARPMPDAQGFDDWQYGDLGHLQFGADLARLQIHQEAQAATAAAASGQQHQDAAGLSVGAGSAGTTPQGDGQVPVSPSGVVDWDKVRSDTESRAGQFGVKV